MRYLSLLASLAVLSLAVPAEAAGLNCPALIGKWQVSGVAVMESASGIQALIDNDPQFMGAVIEFSKDKIIWLQGTKTRKIDPAIDNCNTPPKLTPADNNYADTRGPIRSGYNIICGDKGWGADAVIVPLSANRIKLYWYDNGILSLKREG